MLLSHYPRILTHAPTKISCLSALGWFVLCFLSHQTLSHADRDQHGISRQVHGGSTFTLRNGTLRHEVSKLNDRWVELFYAGSVPVFIRSGQFVEGKPVVTAERFQAEAGTAIRQVSTPGDDYPRRIYIGPEIYNLTETGFFEILPNPEETLKESAILGAEFSTKEIEAVRKSILQPQKNPE